MAILNSSINDRNQYNPLVANPSIIANSDCELMNLKLADENDSLKAKVYDLTQQV